ncbi:Cold shock-like protein CspD [Piscirickettsia salmonis]|uniref:'Cold-shock' DNA-binding domain protein n=2 Tax=Piscirickettsia salmonis TaxID=1238 RepID=A0A9Q5YKX4_PISSA|nr:'Cold-shock' DNA-binding domain protein [Piscirickettsia salmonis]ERL61566.1 'Cold-shock' DNA-binding domain protein [Piscirickettsia salmonis LF-89 = ATCC VR-1361]RNC78796.1 cold shock domain protein CspD [Piscirickettsiaceae bacterium NZ-RLO2]WGZ71542.1 cold shock domain protein CspD [Piscirickettsia salmonis EM-90]ALB22178.1 'Cold-shock' DNA-binding domain protein [Piscirickettsia salmonis]
MATGFVKWFNNAKGYGFIRPAEGGADLFAHFSSIDMDGYRTLKTGQPVSYETNQGTKGLYATNIYVDRGLDDQMFSHNFSTETSIRPSANTPKGSSS